MLLNLVRLRYVESPVFLDVTSVVNSYTASAGVSGGVDIKEGADNGGGVDANASYSDRPTVTYAPRRGEAFTRSLLRPIPPTSLVALAQAGWPVDFLFSLSVNAINGMQNRFGAGERARAADPEFEELMVLLRDLQKSGKAGIRIENQDGFDSAVFFFSRGGSAEKKAGKVRQLLGLDPGSSEFHLTYGNQARDNREIAILSRSLLEIMTELSSYIEVPSQDAEEGRTYPNLSDMGGAKPLLKVKSSGHSRGNSSTAARYRGNWFWVDDRDFRSKRTFSFLMVLSSLTETSGSQSAPVLTIPTG